MKRKISSVFSAGMNHLSACMLPLIPVIIAGSLLKLICLLLDTANLSVGSTGTILSILGDTPFYFLPVLAGITAAQHFGADLFYSAGAACALVMPGLTAMMEGGEGISFLLIPVVKTTYTYSVLPVILLVWLLAKIEPHMEQIFPTILRGTIYPLCIFLSAALLGILVVGPLGTLISQGLAWILEILSARAGVLAWMLLAGLMPLLIPAGMHWVFVMIAITQLGADGVDNGIMVSFFLVGMALGGADIATAIFTKDSEYRMQAASAGLTVLLAGVSEPSLFGICMKEKKTLFCVMASAAVAGIFQGIVGIHCYVYSFPAISSILMFSSSKEPGNLWKAAVAGAIAFVVSFLLVTCTKIKKVRD